MVERGIMIKKNEKKVKEVAALRYSEDDNKSPEIIALGKGETAEKILEKAKESNVPVYEDAQLAHTLQGLNIGDEIPPELYEVVAKILVFISDLDSQYGKHR